MQLSRRGFLGGLAALVAAPAIVPVENLMKLPPRLILPPIDRLDVLFDHLNVRPEWTIPDNLNKWQEFNAFTRESVRLWKNSNTFIRNIDSQYEEQFESSSQIGEKLRIRMLEEAGEIPAGAWEALQSPHSQVKTWT